MRKSLPIFLTLVLIVFGSCSNYNSCNIFNIKKGGFDNITPNQFKGSDIERIQAAITEAEGKTDYNNCGTLQSTMVTMEGWMGEEDDIENIFITNINCSSKFRGIAIRTSDSASTNNVYINGLITRKWHEGSHNSVLAGGKGYGKPSLPGRINNIYAMNIIGNGYSLIHIEAPIENCSFMNGIYNGQSGQYSGDGKPITYNLDKNTSPNQISNIDKDKVRNVVLKNMISIID